MSIFFRLLTYVRAYRFRLILALLCSVGVAGLQAMYAWLVQPLMDGIFIEQDEYVFQVLPVIILGVALLKASFAYGQAYCMSYVGNWIVADVRHQLFVQVVRLPVKFHDSNASGRLVARVLNDVNEMANAIPSIMKDLFQQGLTFVALMGVVFYQNWKLATIMLLIIPASALVIVRLGKRLRKLATRGQESMGDMASVLKETFTGIRLVKAYGGEESETQKFDRTNHAYRSASQKAAQVSALSSPLMEIIGVTGTVIITWYGGYLISVGAMTPGEFSSFFAAMFMAYAPIRRLSGANHAIQRALAASKRVFDVLDLENECDRDHGKESLPSITRSLEFRDVSFSYESSKEPALRHVSLKVQAGEIVALVGSSGSGKSTLVSLVPRFYRPTDGMILIDGQDIREVDRRSLRRQIGIVSQETVLFDDTIRNNIAYGRPSASAQEILEASQSAFAWEFIERLPNGFDSRVGEDGVKLSGGQRQRLAIARAILRDPPILILDEATSALDSESEKLVQAALTNLMRHRTTLVIAHRLSTVQHANRIVVLERGEIVEVGTHAQLLQFGGAYTRLYHTQFEQTMMGTLEPNTV
ncbi:MAG: lipid A export permease/ATP-binding protein MsbA [Nitrospirales bacterium]|nr:lipid A export permease/ATP-binding protein MsbA [Nitrospira sp.]MDR4502392.1 lipid A export permease/ATP-binding protein MsbA [Nitrospirales bacterium]